MEQKGQEKKKMKRKQKREGGVVKGPATVDEVTACGDKRWIEKENGTKI